VRNIKWPWKSNVFVSLLAYFTGNWAGIRELDFREVATINAFLEGQEDLGEAYQLPENAGRIFQGSIFLGDGFLLTDDEAQRMIAADPRNSDVIFPAINGQELNNNPDQAPSRKIINFFDWDMEEAEAYEQPFHRVEEKVKPERLAQKDKGDRDYWWRFLRPRRDLYSRIEGHDRCFVATRTTKFLNFSASPTNRVFLDSLYVFTGDQWQDYAVLQSTLHEVWARKYSGALKQDLRYSPRDCFETFPFPADSAGLESIGETYHEHRRQLMLKMQLGLTKTYNLFHDPNLSPEVVEKASKQNAGIAAEAYQDILKLRNLHRQMDEAVLAAYGWHEDSSNRGPAIDLRHDFYEVDYLPENDRTRYTIHPDARGEILKRLLLLNHERYEEEVKQGLHARKGKKKPAAIATPLAAQDDLFGDMVLAPPLPAVAATHIQNDLANLPDGDWARTTTNEVDDEIAVLAAVLKALAGPAPAREVRLADLLAIEPRLLTPSLTGEEAKHWKRLIGPEAEPLDKSVTQLQPSANHAWGAALRQLRGNGRLVVDETNQIWGPGAGLDVYVTEGLWPEGRVRMVFEVLRKRGADVIVQTLPETVRDWFDARAA
jgi:hypothetical protein